MRNILLFIFFLCTVSCLSQSDEENLQVGAQQTNVYLPMLQGKNVALVVNQSSLIDHTHLVDSLLTLGVHVKTIFSPEHGFRGNADAGEKVKSSVDSKTGLPIVSLYGNNKKPKPEQLKNIDAVVFDLQDVGVRFYTYISSMHYVMEACAEMGIEFVVLDRPNPNGDYFDGPVLQAKYKSFVGMHPIPVVHGLTVGELAEMINGEGWLKDSVRCRLTVVKMAHYTHDTKYELPIKPSPNLPNYQSIRLYPSLCFFEPTQISIGRGTYFPFQVVGFPNSEVGDFSFTPVSIDGMAKKPKHENEVCTGLDLRKDTFEKGFTLKYLIDFYTAYPDKEAFFTNAAFFNLLGGNGVLIQQIRDGKTEAEIRASWQSDLIEYGLLRKKYLLYP